jgi:hypothetical protein
MNYIDTNADRLKSDVGRMRKGMKLYHIQVLYTEFNFGVNCKTQSIQSQKMRSDILLYTQELQNMLSICALRFALHSVLSKSRSVA